VAWSTTATANDVLWGSTPIKTFSCAHTSVSVGLLPSSRARVTPHASGTGGTQAENEPTHL
jgi:hypothetical protein